jgi:hypothetical protein
MRYPPRLAHLATRAVVVAKLAPTYSEAHSIDDEEGISRLDRALNSPLLDDLLAAAWTELLGTQKKLDEEGLVQKVASGLKNRPQRPGKIAPLSPGWSAFLVLADVRAGIASDAAQRLLETDEGAKRAKAGLAEVGKFLAGELVRK